MKKTTSLIKLSAIGYWLIAISGCNSGNKNKGPTIDKITPYIIPVSSYVLLGDKYKAEVGFRAYSTTQPFELKIDSAPDQSSTYKDGVFQYEIIPDKEGLHQFKGELIVKNPENNQISSYSFEKTYMVAKPTAIIVPSEFV